MGVGSLNLLRKILLQKEKRMKEYETKLNETICTEFTVSKKKWFCLSVYRPPSPNNVVTFFEELTDSLSRAINNYDNIILMGDFNIDIKKENSIAYDKLEEFCDTFNLTNLVKSETCFMNNHKSAIDLILTNKPRSFQITNVTETGISDCHKLITTFMKLTFLVLNRKMSIIVVIRTSMKKNFSLTLRKRIFLLKQVIPTRTIQS